MKYLLKQYISYILASALVLFVVIGLVSFVIFSHRISTPPGFVTVLVDKPFWTVFSNGGVRHDVQPGGTTSLYWVTTKGIEVPNYDFKIDEPFDDLPTKNQSFIDFKSYLKFRVTDPVRLVTDFRFDAAEGAGWYAWYQHALKEQYRSIVRDVSKEYTMEDILSKPETAAAMEQKIRNKMDELIKQIKIPLMLTDISLGSASPNQPVKAEIDRTAAEQQRIKTEVSRKLAEDSRFEAETAKAAADNAYRQKMNMSPEQFVALEQTKMMAAACRTQGVTCVIANPGNPVMVHAK